MQILSIEFKNFNSYGNRIQRIEFPRDKAGFFVVRGPVGVGKTTIKDVIEFALYGKVSGRKLKEIPNRMNGNAWVKVELIAKNKNVIIEAGLDPTMIALTVDGTPYNKANTRGPREYLTEELLEIPFHVFTNIVSISILDFKSFLNMNKEDKKNIIDKIFGFHIINLMRDTLKTHTKLIKEKLDAAAGSLDMASRSMEHSQQELEQLSKKLQEVSDDKIKETKENLEKYVKLMDLHKSKMKDFHEKEAEYKNEVYKLSNMMHTAQNTTNQINRKLKLYEDSKCPTCASDLTTDFHQSIKEEWTTELSKAKKDMDAAQKLYNEATLKEKSIAEDRKKFMEKETIIRSNITTFTNELRKLEGGPKDEQVQSIKNIITKMETQIETSKNDKNRFEELMTWNKMIDDVLGEKGVKQMAIRTVLPALNAEIYRLMNEVHMDFKITFNEEFEAVITHLGTEISTGPMSRGEKKKADFVVLIAIIRMMKMRYPSINLLFLDEIIDGLDADSVYTILKVLGRSCKEQGLNTFVISHTQELPKEIFDYSIEIEKKNNFSNLQVLNI